MRWGRGGLRGWAGATGTEEGAAGGAPTAAAAPHPLTPPTHPPPHPSTPSAADLALTARTVSGAEALSLGLVSRTFADAAALLEGAGQAARALAARPPLALAGTKRVLLHQR